MNSVFPWWFRNDRWSALLEAGANAAKDSARLAGERARRTDGAASMDDLFQIRRKGRRIAEEVSERLGRAFVTPFERGHMASLAFVLGGIPATIEKFCAEFQAAGPSLAPVDLPMQVDRVEKATAIVADMAAHLRRRAHPDRIHELNDRLKHHRDEAEKSMAADVRSLDGGPQDTLRVLAAHDLFDLLTEIFDRCRDAGRWMSRIALAYGPPSPDAKGRERRNAGLLLRTENA